MKQFFLDTANTESLKRILEKIEKKIDLKSVRGITTNPNAFNKIGITRLEGWLDHSLKLAKFVHEIRGDNDGEIHIQIPNSNLNHNQVTKYISLIKDMTKGYCKVGMKISPNVELLEKVDEFNLKVKTNVTGLSDVSTALKCCTYNVDYISIIPGRMEEVGVNAIETLSFLKQCKLGQTRIITGSQRTVEQVIYCFNYDTIPTIGEKCWDNIFMGGNFEKLLIGKEESIKVNMFGPLITNENINLSVNFFKQMDELGLPAFSDLKEIS